MERDPKNPLEDGSFYEAVAGDTTRLTAWYKDISDRWVIVEFQAPEGGTVYDKGTTVTVYPSQTT